jgi:TolB-like protein/tetratricopeptide (TPR) repeat protein
MPGPHQGLDAAEPPAEERLDSWKEIAAYLRRGTRTAQRWASEQGLPVHRLAHGKQGQVFAYKSELDAWWRSRRTDLEPEAPPRPRGRFWRITLAAGAIAVVAAAVYLFWSWRKPAPAEGQVTLAVLPFENLSRDPEQEYFSDGLTEEMITQLTRLQPGRLAVIARTSAMPYKRTAKKVNQIGRELGVDYILEGAVRREGRRARISAQLVRVSDQVHVWADSYDRELSGILAVQSEVARAVTGQIKLTLTAGEEARLSSARPVVVEAHEAYLKGRFFWNKRRPEDLHKALGFFAQAIEKDPRHAPAYAGMADTYILLEEYAGLPPREAVRKARAAAERALAIDPDLAEAHASLGLVRYSHDWDWKGAEASFRRAIELSPSCVTAHHWYANLLASLGRADEARAEIGRAQKLDPLSPVLLVAAAWRVGAALGTSYEAAIPGLRTALEIHPAYPVGNARLALAYALSGRRQEGIRQVEEALPQVASSTPLLAELGSIYGLLGETAKARELLAKLTDRARQSYISPYRLALIHVALGENDAAMKLLQQGFEERDIGLVMLRLDPRWDPLRGAPRFRDLLRRMRLPE